MKTFNYSKYINCTWDNEILGYISQIHEYKGRQDSFILTNPIKINKLVDIAKIQSTEASNKIEGIVTTSARIKQICEDKTTPKNRDEREIAGYRDVLNTIHENYEYIPINSLYLLQLHKDLYKYSSKDIGGKFKSNQNYIKEQRLDGTESTRFTPLTPFETPDAMDRLCETFNMLMSECDVDPLILIPTFILDFLCIHPFSDGNGRMSRLLTILLLYKAGYMIGKYISIEKIIAQRKDEYYDTLLESSTGWHEDKNDPTSFIKYMLSVILYAYRDFEERTKLLNENKVSSTMQVVAAINAKYGKFTKKDLVLDCPMVSETTIERLLKSLLEQGLIVKYGDYKSTYYTKVDNILINSRFVNIIQQQCYEEFGKLSIDFICEAIEYGIEHFRIFSSDYLSEALEGLQRIKNCFMNKFTPPPTKSQLKALIKILEMYANNYMSNENEKSVYKLLLKIAEISIDNNNNLI